jgi:hypothetical protein
MRRLAHAGGEDDARPERLCERRLQKRQPTEAGDPHQHTEKSRHERRLKTREPIKRRYQA